MLLRVKALRRFLSILVLTLADGAALVLGLLTARTGRGPGCGSRAALASGLDLGLRHLSPLRPGAQQARPGSAGRGRPLVGGSRCRRGGDLPGERPGARLDPAGSLLALLCAGTLRLLYEQGHREDLPPRHRSDACRGGRQGGGQGQGTPDDRARPGRLRPRGRGGLRRLGRGSRGAAEALDRTEAREVVLVGAELLPDEEFLELLRSVRLRGIPLRVVPGALALMRSRPPSPRA